MHLLLRRFFFEQAVLFKLSLSSRAVRFETMHRSRRALGAHWVHFGARACIRDEQTFFAVSSNLHTVETVPSTDKDSVCVLGVRTRRSRQALLVGTMHIILVWSDRSRAAFSRLNDLWIQEAASSAEERAANGRAFSPAVRQCVFRSVQESSKLHRSNLRLNRSPLQKQQIEHCFVRDLFANNKP